MARIKRSIRACSQTMGAPEVPQVVDFIHRALWRAWASVARHRTENRAPRVFGRPLARNAEVWGRAWGEALSLIHGGASRGPV
jgi:hypothetical protein